MNCLLDESAPETEHFPTRPCGQNCRPSRIQVPRDGMGGMVDPTSDLGENVDEESAPRCATCGEPVLGVGRRAVTWVDDDRVEYRHFCDEKCRAEWDDERSTAE